MIKKSLLLNYIILLCSKLCVLITESKTWHFFAVCNNKFNKSANNSFFVRICSKADNLDIAYKNRLGKISGCLSRFFNKIFSALAGSVHGSLIIVKANDICKCFFNIPLIFPGITLIIWGGVSCILSHFTLSENAALYLSILLVVIGVILVFLRKSANCLLHESFFVAKFLALLSLKLPNDSTPSKYHSYKDAVHIGIILSLVTCVFGILPVAISVVLFAIIAFGFCFTSFVAWVYICVLPFMPTMVMVLGGLALLLCIVIKSVFGYKSKMFNDTYTLNMFFLFMGIAFAIAAVFSYARTSSVKIALVYIAFLCATYALIRLLSTKKMLLTVINGISVFSIPVSLFGIFQHFTGFDEQNTWIDTEMFDEISGRVVSFFGNPNVFGEYLILVILTSLICFFIMNNKYVKLLHLLAVGFSGVALIFTYSRGCWIGVLFAIVIFLFMSKRKVFAAFCVLGMCSVFFLPDSIITRFTSVGNLADSSTSYRVYIWEGTLKMLKDFWVTGIGLGSDAFNAIYPLYAYSAITAPHPHNLYLVILTETGMVGAVAFLTIIVFYYKRLFSVVKNSNDNTLKIIASGLVAAMSGFLLQGMFDNVWYNYRVFLLFWIYIAIGAVVDVVSRRFDSGEN